MLTLAAVRASHAASARAAATTLAQAGGDPAKVFAALEGSEANRDTARHAATTFDLARRAYLAGQASADAAARNAAIALADFTLQRYRTPAGTFIEYDRAAWLKPEQLWRTIPWGVAFRAKSLIGLLKLMQAELPAATREQWTSAVADAGSWVYRNGIVGTFVFNCVVDLCAVLWSAGEIIDRPEWVRWARDAIHARIARDIDNDGWIHGENGGVSGAYQLVGGRFLAELAWDTRDPVLCDATARVARALRSFATPTLQYSGNFGTRSPHLGPANGAPLVVAAALGDAHAAHCVRTSGRPEWFFDDEAWAAAFTTEPAAPTPQPVTRIPALDATVVRHGPFVAWWANYSKSLWARGQTALWHDGPDDEFVCASLHSLPSTVEKAKLHLDNTVDWAGFPHVRVVAAGTDAPGNYDSHQRIESLDVTSTASEVVVNWSEPLLSRTGQVGGRMDARWHFVSNQIRMRIALSHLIGPATLDFHVMRKPYRFAGIWWGDVVDQLRRGELPASGGWHHDQSFDPTLEPCVALQIDRTTHVFTFDAASIPSATTLHIGEAATTGLHTGNVGGFRVRLQFTTNTPSASVALTYDVVTTSDPSISQT